MARVAGIEVTLERPAHRLSVATAGARRKTTKHGKTPQLLARVIRGTEKVDFDENRPPGINVTIEGDVNAAVPSLPSCPCRSGTWRKNGRRLDEVSAEANMSGDILTITSLRADRPHEDFPRPHRLQSPVPGKAASMVFLAGSPAAAGPRGWVCRRCGTSRSAETKPSSAEGDFRLDELNAPQIQ